MDENWTGRLREGQVFGPPIEREGVTLLPVVRVPRRGAPRAVGAWVVRDGKAEWQPVLDLTRVIVMGDLVAIVALLVLRPLISRRPPHG
jgi:hypothetical protein